jgi:glycosidase
VYEVFVRSFADSDGDGTGDLNGLTAHLDDLEDGDPGTTTDLGVDAVWLMPIFPSPSYHGYDVTDYRSVNPQYGTLGDFDAFVAGAHQRGIKVILDMVLNHSSSQHPWFLDSEQAPAAARRDWYVWSPTDPGWFRPFGGGSDWYLLNGFYYYGIFSPSMPDLNLGNPAVEAELTDAMKAWMARGVDGFRLDAVRYYFASGRQAQQDQPETHAFLRRLRQALQQDHPAALLVDEAWAPATIVASYYGQGDEAQLAFSFDLAGALVTAGLTGNASGVTNAFAAAQASLAGKDLGFQAPFLTNHDQVRAYRAMGGDAGAARVVAATLLALPGTPFLYYGEEIGMQGGTGPDDRAKRTPFHWTSTGPGYGFTTGASTWWPTPEAAGVDVDTQRADPTSLWNLYRRLLALRRGRTELSRGDASLPAVSGGGSGIFALRRSTGSGRVLFVANYAAAATGPFTVAEAGAPVALESEGLGGAPVSTGGSLSFPGLAGRSFVFLSLE